MLETLFLLFIGIVLKTLYKPGNVTVFENRQPGNRNQLGLMIQKFTTKYQNGQPDIS